MALKRKNIVPPFPRSNQPSKYGPFRPSYSRYTKKASEKYVAFRYFPFSKAKIPS